MADQRSLALVLALSVIAVLIFVVAVACNAATVATVNWVSYSSCVLLEVKGVLGLWRTCGG